MKAHRHGFGSVFEWCPSDVYRASGYSLVAKQANIPVKSKEGLESVRAHCFCQAHDRHPRSQLPQRGHDQGAVVIGRDKWLVVIEPQHGARTGDGLTALPRLYKTQIHAACHDATGDFKNLLRRWIGSQPSGWNVGLFEHATFDQKAPHHVHGHIPAHQLAVVPAFEQQGAVVLFDA